MTTGAFADFSVRTLSPIEIFGSKIIALASRAAVRDLYDIYNMIVLEAFNAAELLLLRKCAVFYQAVAGTQEFNELSFDRMSSITKRRIKTDLYPVIRNSERFDFNHAKQLVSEFLTSQIVLSEDENEFLRRFASGQYVPEFLFDDGEILARICEHPMALWRIQRASKR